MIIAIIAADQLRCCAGLYGKIINWFEKAKNAYRITVAAPIKIGKDMYYMGVMIMSDANTRRLYLHDVVIEKEISNFLTGDPSTIGAGKKKKDLSVSSLLDEILFVKHKEPVFSEFFVGYDTGMTGIEAMKKSAENYIRMCRERGMTPKFAQFMEEDNYWKLLIDRKMINNKTGEPIRQKSVSTKFDTEVIKGTVDKYVENYDQGVQTRALNYVAEHWDELPARIKDLKKTAKKPKTQKALDTLANETVAAQPGRKFSLPNAGNNNKNSRASNGSPLTRRSVKQRSVGSTHVNMSSTAAAEILGIPNIADLDDSVKNVMPRKMSVLLPQLIPSLVCCWASALRSTIRKISKKEGHPHLGQSHKEVISM